MAQTLVTYLLVAVAAGWVVWSMALPKPVKQALRARVSLKKAAPAGKDGCDCGPGGGCH